MQQRHWMMFLTGFYILAAMYLARELLTGSGFGSMMKVMLILTPVLLSVLIKLRPYWPALLFASTLSKEAFSVPLLDIFTYGFFVAIAICTFFLMELAILKRQTVARSALLKSFVLLFLVLVLRLIIEHPGSARLGTSGGLGQAIYYTLAPLLGYISAQIFAAGDWDIRKNLRAILFIAIAVLGYATALNMMQGMPFSSWACFNYNFPYWALIGALLAWSNVRTRLHGGHVQVMLVTALVIVLSLLSRFRMVTLMSVIAMLVLAIAYRRSAKHLLYPFLLAGVALLILNVMPLHKLPFSMYRAASLVIHIDPTQLPPEQAQYAGEFGWQSTFRERLYQVAMVRMTAHPLWGEGWTFSFEDIVVAVTSMLGPNDPGAGGLIFSGNYHNLLLTFAIKLGLPVALWVTLCLLLPVVFFLRKFRRPADSPAEQIFKGMLLFFTLIYLGFSLTNGAGQETVVLFTLGGMMLGLILRESKAEADVINTPKKDVPRALMSNL